MTRNFMDPDRKLKLNNKWASSNCFWSDFKGMKNTERKRTIPSEKDRTVTVMYASCELFDIRGYHSDWYRFAYVRTCRLLEKNTGIKFA